MTLYWFEVYCIFFCLVNNQCLHSLSYSSRQNQSSSCDFQNSKTFPQLFHCTSRSAEIITHWVHLWGHWLNTHTLNCMYKTRLFHMINHTHYICEDVESTCTLNCTHTSQHTLLITHRQTDLFIWLNTCLNASLLVRMSVWVKERLSFSSIQNSILTSNSSGVFSPFYPRLPLPQNIFCSTSFLLSGPYFLLVLFFLCSITFYITTPLSNRHTHFHRSGVLVFSSELGRGKGRGVCMCASVQSSRPVLLCCCCFCFFLCGLAVDFMIYSAKGRGARPPVTTERAPHVGLMISPQKCLLWLGPQEGGRQGLVGDRGREKKKEKEGGTGRIGTSAHADSCLLAHWCG